MKKISKSFEFTILVWWIWSAEVAFLLLLIVFHFPGVLKFQGFRREGTMQTIQLLDADVVRNESSRPYVRVKCKAVLDGMEYEFFVKYDDVREGFSISQINKLTEDMAEIEGYLYSSGNRKNFYFSSSIYKKEKFLLRKLKEELDPSSETATWIRRICYLIFGIVTAIKLSPSPKRDYSRYGHKVNKQGDKYTNRAIKNDPEYSLQEKKIFAQNYPWEIVEVAKALRSGVIRVSEQQVKALQGMALKKTKKSDPEEEEWFYGRSVMTELSTTSPADAIYRIYREGHYEEEILEPEEKLPAEQELEGPILSDHAVAREAVLLRAGAKKLFQKKRKLLLAERTREGDFALHQIEPDYFMAREMPGNYVLIIKERDIVGVYENILKNEGNPIMRECDQRMKKIRREEIIYHCKQYAWFFVSLVLLVIAWNCTWTWFTFTAAGVYMIAVHTYKRFALSVAKEYEKRHGRLIFEGLFRVRWGIPYTILKIIAVCLLIGKYVCNSVG